MMKNSIFFNILNLIGSKTYLQRLVKALHQLLNQLNFDAHYHSVLPSD